MLNPMKIETRVFRLMLFALYLIMDYVGELVWLVEEEYTDIDIDEAYF